MRISKSINLIISKCRQNVSKPEYKKSVKNKVRLIQYWDPFRNLSFKIRLLFYHAAWHDSRLCNPVCRVVSLRCIPDSVISYCTYNMISLLSRNCSRIIDFNLHMYDCTYDTLTGGLSDLYQVNWDDDFNSFRYDCMVTNNKVQLLHRWDPKLPGTFPLRILGYVRTITMHVYLDNWKKSICPQSNTMKTH